MAKMFAHYLYAQTHPVRRQCNETETALSPAPKSLTCGPVHDRVALVVQRVHVGPVRQQQVDQLQIALDDGQVQWREPVLIGLFDQLRGHHCDAGRGHDVPRAAGVVKGPAVVPVPPVDDVRLEGCGEREKRNLPIRTFSLLMWVGGDECERDLAEFRC